MKRKYDDSSDVLHNARSVSKNKISKKQLARVVQGKNKTKLYCEKVDTVHCQNQQCSNEISDQSDDMSCSVDYVTEEMLTFIKSCQNNDPLLVAKASNCSNHQVSLKRKTEGQSCDSITSGNKTYSVPADKNGSGVKKSLLSFTCKGDERICPVFLWNSENRGKLSLELNGLLQNRKVMPRASVRNVNSKMSLKTDDSKASCSSETEEVFFSENLAKLSVHPCTTDCNVVSSNIYLSPKTCSKSYKLELKEDKAVVDVSNNDVSHFHHNQMSRTHDGTYLSSKGMEESQHFINSVIKADILEKVDLPPFSEFVALDCEFVGVGLEKQNALGRCSIVDYEGAVLFDQIILPEGQITDYRTPWSGLRPADMKRAIPFSTARSQVLNIIKDKIVVGHAVRNDFRVLQLHHDPCRVRDTSRCRHLQTLVKQLGGTALSLQKLTRLLLGRSIQEGEHCSVEDARASLDLYKLVQDSWERELLSKAGKKWNSKFSELRCFSWMKHNLPKLYFQDEYWPSDMEMSVH